MIPYKCEQLSSNALQQFIFGSCPGFPSSHPGQRNRQKLIPNPRLCRSPQKLRGVVSARAELNSARFPPGKILLPASPVRATFN